MVTPSLILPRQPDERWQQAKQLGVDSVVVHTLEIGDNQSQWTYDELRAMQNWFVDAGLTIDVIEGSVPIPDRVRLGEEGRDADIAEFKQFLRDCGDVGIPVVCYDWMAGTRWARTEAHLESRGVPTSPASTPTNSARPTTAKPPTSPPSNSGRPSSTSSRKSRP